MKIHLELKVVRIEIQIHLILEGELPGLKEMLNSSKKGFLRCKYIFGVYLFLWIYMGGRATELEEKLPEAQTRKTPLPKRYPAVEKTNKLFKCQCHILIKD